jgi:hypothetical protein
MVQDVIFDFAPVAVVGGEGKLSVQEITVLVAWMRSEVTGVMRLHVVEPQKFT